MYGRWTYSWDAENRLVQMICDTDSPAGARQKLLFEYGHQGRRIRKQYFTGSYWQKQADTIFLYDGWNLVAEPLTMSSSIPDKLIGRVDDHIAYLASVSASGGRDPNDPNHDPLDHWKKELEAFKDKLKQKLKQLPNNRLKREP